MAFVNNGRKISICIKLFTQMVFLAILLSLFGADCLWFNGFMIT